MGFICVNTDDVSGFISHAWRCADAHQNQFAEAYFQDAIRIDLTVHSRIEYAEFLADCVSTVRAIEELENSLNEVRNDDYQNDFILIYNRIAALYRELGNTPQSFRYQQYAISAEMKRFDSTSFPQLHRSSTLGFAHDLIQNREFTSAKFLLTSLSIDDDVVGNKARISLADLYIQEEEFTAAELMLEKATAWIQENDEIPQLIRSLELKSQIHIERKAFARARHSLNEAIRLAMNNARCSRLLPQLKSARRRLSLQMSVLCQKAEWN